MESRGLGFGPVISQSCSFRTWNQAQRHYSCQASVDNDTAKLMMTCPLPTSSNSLMTKLNQHDQLNCCQWNSQTTFSCACALVQRCHFHSGDDKIEEELTEETWTHPAQRSDDMIKKDPELKSLLSELASDFGRHGDENTEETAVSTSDREVDQNCVVDSVTHKSDGENESRLSDGEQLETAMKADDDHKFHPVDTEKLVQHTTEKNYVFSIDALVNLLRDENAKDICVINIPKEKQYVDYFVIVTGRSPRHLKAMAHHVNQQYKARKCKEHPFLIVEGEQTDDWMCIDFGNIVLHLMSDETRELYELEKLWTLGPEFDDQFRRLKEYETMIKESFTDVGAAANNNDQSQDEVSDGTLTSMR